MDPLLGLGLAAAALYFYSLKEADQADDEPDPEDSGGSLSTTFKPTPTVPGEPQPQLPPPDLVGPGAGQPSPSPTPAVPPSPAPPPNVSGDSAGYNTELFPDPKSVRKALRFLGYPVNENLTTPPPASQVKRFQGHYNQSSIMEQYDAVGYLDEDGVPGKFTLRGLEIAVSGTDGPDLGDFARGFAWAQEHGL